MSETTVCLGTKTVTLRDRENGSEKEGLVAIFHQSTLSSSSIPAEAPTASPSKILQVNVTDGRAVYRGEIDMDRVKMKLLDDLEDHNDKPKQALRMAGYLLHDTVAQIEPVYTYLDNNNNNTIQLVIKYQHISHKSGEDDEDAAMKKAWSGNLTRIHKTKNDDDDPNSNNNNANDNTNALLQFSTALGNSINQERRNMAHLRQTMQVVQTDRASWKETADQLSGKWDSEKDTLFHNFATLYNKTRQELAATRTQLRDLQAQLEVSEANNNINNDKGKARAPKRAKKKEISFADDEEMPDQPDDNDNLFDASMANALASGNRVDINIKKENSSTETSKKKTTKGKRKDASDSDKDDDDSSSNGMAKRKKSSKAILTFDDDSDDDSIAKKIRAQIAAGDMNTSSDDDVDNSNYKNNTAII